MNNPTIQVVTTGPTSVVEVSTGPRGLKGDTGTTGATGPAQTNASDLTEGTVDDARLPDTARAATLAATYARVPGSQNVIIGLGDSLTLGNDTTTGTIQHGDCMLTWASLLSGGRIIHGGNAGVAGQSSTAILGRVASDVIAKNPGSCMVLCGTNDIPGGDFTTYQANIRAIVTQLQGAGIRVFLSTMPPSGSSGYRTRIVQWNAWLRRYAQTQGVDLVDFYGLLVDSTTGDYAAGFINDGVHPNTAGWKAMGQLMSDRLCPRLPENRPAVATDNNDPNNLLSNGLNIVDTNADGLADGPYDYSGLIAGASRSLVTDALVPGKMQRLALGTTSGDNIIEQDMAGAGFTPGDLIAFSTVYTATAGCAYVDIQLNFVGGAGPNLKPIHITQAITRGQVYIEATVPAGTTSIATIWRVNGVSCSADFGQRTVYNLTALGIV